MDQLSESSQNPGDTIHPPEPFALDQRARLALDTILGQSGGDAFSHTHPSTKGIPTWEINPMEWRMIDRLAGLPEGSYRRDPIPTYHRMYGIAQPLRKNSAAAGDRREGNPIREEKGRDP